MAGVATAIVLGGPGAIFWMWLIALLGAASAFVESTLAQLYKRKGKDSFIGGPAYYMELGLKKRWMGVVFAILIIVTFGLAFNPVQSNTLCAAAELAFGLDNRIVGIIITILAFLIIFCGIHRIATFSAFIIATLALGYILVTVVLLLVIYLLILSVFSL